MLTLELIVIVRPQVTVRNIVLEYMPYHRQDRMSYGHSRSMLAAPCGNAMVLRGKIRVFYVPRRFGALDQHSLERPVAFVRPAMLPLPSTLMVPWGYTCP